MAVDELIFGLRLVFDTAALVLIWLVQLVIYPAFLHYANADFRRWHPLYTRRVTLVVMPVMLGQVGAYAGALAVEGARPVLVLNALLIAAAWGITFFRAVPLHGRLDAVTDHLADTASLLAVNWWRTVVWSLVWLLTVGEFLLSIG